MVISFLKTWGMILVLTALYLVAVLRYFPGDFSATLHATLMHLAGAVPFAGGLTFLVVAFLGRGEKRPPWTTILRLYIMFGIMTEFFLGLYDYLGRNV